MPKIGDLTALRDRTFDAVLFDNDGTLVDSTAAVERSWTTWAREFDIDPYALAGFHGVPAAGIVSAVGPHLDHEQALARIVELEVSDDEGIVALPGAIDAVAALAPKHCAIVTSATRTLGEMRLATAGIPIPDVVVTFDDIEHGKPHPDPFLEGAKRLGLDPARCLVVEDAPSGLQAARAAGCATLAVTTTTPGEELDADAVVTNLAQVRLSWHEGAVHIAPANESDSAPTS